MASAPWRTCRESRSPQSDMPMANSASGPAISRKTGDHAVDDDRKHKAGKPHGPGPRKCR